MKPTLVVLAAGIGSRFGGLKQIEPITEDGKCILDFSIYDAKKAGFGKVVFIIREDIENDFKQYVGNRISKIISVEYVYQSIKDLPKGRVKPYGTGHAIYCCKDVIHEPFAVINADDYYGPNAFYDIVKHLNGAQKGEYTMMAYLLKNTLSKYGTVSRGICKIKDQYLQEVIEYPNIDFKGNSIETNLPLDSLVSMNLWGFTLDIFEYITKEYENFLIQADLNKDELFLPTIISNMIQNQIATVFVFLNNDKWYGITYKEDLEEIKNSIAIYIRNGLYKHI